VPLLVEEQDRARVGVEQGANGVEQPVRDVRPSVREGSVGHGLQAVEPISEPFHEARMAECSRAWSSS
jgi:hypothetical protein